MLCVCFATFIIQSIVHVSVGLCITYTCARCHVHFCKVPHPVCLHTDQIRTRSRPSPQGFQIARVGVPGVCKSTASTICPDKARGSCWGKRSKSVSVRLWTVHTGVQEHLPGRLSYQHSSTRPGDGREHVEQLHLIASGCWWHGHRTSTRYVYHVDDELCIKRCFIMRTSREVSL